MEGELDPFPFVLAEALGMTIEDMLNRMSNQEYLQWQAFFTWRHAMQQLELEAARGKK